ncbi:MAG: hypothetical protein PGN13_02990 [Patulibacter minatonensis]
MADDRLDDAIDAVVRAVDRIERATRGPKPGADEEAHASDLGAPRAKVSPGRDVWDEGHGKKAGKGKKKKRHGEAAHPRATLPEPPDLEPADEALEPEPLFTTAPFAGVVQPGSGSLPPAHAPAEVHELVGRIVARTQELDDHLTAASELRREVTELVARLAAAATHPR